MDGTVLVADDDQTIRTVLTQALIRAGCRVHATSSLTTLMRWVEEGRGDVIITDVMMPDGNGLEFIPKIHQDRPKMKVIVISAQNTIMTAIEAKKVNAFGYLPKPFDLPELMALLRSALEPSAKIAQPAPAAVPASAVTQDILPLIGNSSAMQEVFKSVAGLVNLAQSVVIEGPSGAGKTLISKVLHEQSSRTSLPYIRITQDDMRQNDAHHTILKQVKNGSLIIENIDDFSPTLQASLLSLLEVMSDGGPRVVATSTRGLSTLVASGAMRSDLYYRLAQHEVLLPALASRGQDIKALAEYFLAQHLQAGHLECTLTDEAQDALMAYHWPGNVRQLQNVIGRAVATSERILTAEIFERILAGQPGHSPRMDAPGFGTMNKAVRHFTQKYFDMHGQDLPPPGVYGRLLAEFEAPVLEVALHATAGNQAKCADLLGINRNTLRKKINLAEIEVPKARRLH